MSRHLNSKSQETYVSQLAELPPGQKLHVIDDEQGELGSMSTL